VHKFQDNTNDDDDNDYDDYVNLTEDNVYSFVIMSQTLREFIQLTRPIQTIRIL